jgi:N-acetylmuramoyl-L-alanine amidase
MNIKHLILFLLVTGFIYGCKTTGLIEPLPVEEEEEVSEQAFEIKEYYLPAGSWKGEDEAIRTKINEAALTAASEGCNSLFIKAEELPAAGAGSLEYAIEAAHENELKLFVAIKLLNFHEELEIMTLPELKQLTREEAETWFMNYNIDGMGYVIPGNSGRPGMINDTALYDLLEDAIAWSLLHKSYLLNAIIHDGGNGKTVTEQLFIQVSPQEVTGLDFSGFFRDGAAGRKIYLEDGNRAKICSSDGFIGIISSLDDTLRLMSSEGEIKLSTRGWQVPYNYTVLQDDTVVRSKPWVEFRRMPSAITTDPGYDLLCMTDYPATVSIEGEEVKQYKTGIFFKSIILEEGPNRIRATVMTEDSLSTFYEQEYFYEKTDIKRKVFPLWIDEGSLEPSYDLELLPGDIVRFAFMGSRGQEAYIRIDPADYSIRCSREDFEDYSLYRADVPVNKLRPGEKYSIGLELRPIDGQQGHSPCEIKPGRHLLVREPEDFPLVKVKNDNTRVTYNLGAPRLGGPLRAETGPGVVYKTSGRFGDYYRVQLSSTENGFLGIDDVDILPAGSVKPSYFISSMSCAPSADADVLSIPYPEPVPWEIYPDPAGKRISIHLYGVKTSSTWVSHYDGLKIIDMITWEQSSPETYKVHINLKTSEIWGYNCSVREGRLVLRLKYPPVFDPLSDEPLKGLKIAIEAGHGGSSTGAIGLSGLPEKDINLDLSFRLGELCRQMGAEVVQVRDADIDMSLLEKRNIAISSGADMLISIHANAGGRGYLSVDGTSTYWHNPFWAPLAQAIYERLLELDLDEFGVVGSFNYTVTRVSQMPSVLVEQAFLSHAEDEEKLADEDFRQQMAEKICQGIIDYLRNTGKDL